MSVSDLRIVPCQICDRAGGIDAAIMAIDRVRAPEATGERLRLTQGRRRPAG